MRTLMLQIGMCPNSGRNDLYSKLCQVSLPSLPPSPDASPPTSWDPSMEPLTVSVEKGTRSSSSSSSPHSPGGDRDKGVLLLLDPDHHLPLRFYSDPRSMYPIHSSPRGLALIINNIQFTNDVIYPYRQAENTYMTGL